MLGLDLDRLGIDDFEVEDEVRPDFPCPYCYEDFDIVSLCSHLEDEHSCESKVTVRVSLHIYPHICTFCFSLYVWSVRESQIKIAFLIWLMLESLIFVGKAVYAHFDSLPY